jgi:predicted RNA-binding protein with PIN domain
MATEDHTDVPCADVEIAHRDLRDALEFAVAMAAELAKMKPPVDAPREVRRFANSERLPTSALGRVRRAVEADDLFRRRIAAGAIPELVDPIGRLWLARPDGWQDSIARELAARDESRRSDDAEKALRRSEKRRVGAEEATRRAVGEIVGLRAAAEQARDEAAALRTELEDRDAELAGLRDDVVAARLDERHARDRERAAAERLAAVSEPERPMPAPEDVRRHEEANESLEVLQRSVAEAADAADRLAAELRRAVATAGTGTPAGDDAQLPDPPRRVPLRLPGGVSAVSDEAARFLLRSDAVVLVDGYNVAMLAWPERDLCDQRDALVDALENVARRFGTSVTIVFDGATVIGSFAGRRRVVRVVYSPEGVTADDVIRDEVARTSPSAPVVVVTNDAEIVRDVKAAGANVISSTTFVGLL